MVNGKEITGVEFLLVFDNGGRYWSRLQGSGGLWGAGSLAALNSPSCTQETADHILNRVLSGVQAELERESQVRAYQDHEDHTKRIFPAYPTRIVKARYI